METDGLGTVGGEVTIPTVNADICSGCGRCVAACPEKVITLEAVEFHKNAAITYPERCNACKRCLEACPIAALH